MPKHCIQIDSDTAANKTITKSLLEKSNIVCWTNYGRAGLFGLGQKWEDTVAFKEKFAEFQLYFIEKTIDNIEYGEIVHKNMKFNHYFFKIEGAVKDFISQEGPIPVGNGFWDPIYYHDEDIVAITIAHEGVIKFY